MTLSFESCCFVQPTVSKNNKDLHLQGYYYHDNNDDVVGNDVDEYPVNDTNIDHENHVCMYSQPRYSKVYKVLGFFQF